MLLALPFILLRLLWKSLNLPAYRQRISERLGLNSNLHSKPGGFLVHAVSVGEVVLTIPLIKALKHQYPHLDITLTTTTPTGSQRVTQTFAQTVQHSYLPYDLPWMVNAFLNKVRPACLIIMETEIWPHLINACRTRNIPVIIANGRLSDNSIRRYVWVKFFIANVLQQVTYVTAQSEIDGERFLQLGLPPNKLQITGNLKFDAPVNEQQQSIGKALKAELAQRLIWVAASTHAGEEEQILGVFKQVQKQIPNLLLVLIPRHPDRFAAIADLLTAQQFNFVRRSTQEPCTNETEILLGDSMGEMGIYYAMADVAYVGGSLVPIGGHNLLEPAALGIPTITGPHYHNFKEITQSLQKADAVRVIATPEELAQEVIALLVSPQLRMQRKANALQVIMQNRGAIQKLINVVKIKMASCSTAY